MGPPLPGGIGELEESFRGYSLHGLVSSMPPKGVFEKSAVRRWAWSWETGGQATGKWRISKNID